MPDQLMLSIDDCQPGPTDSELTADAPLAHALEAFREHMVLQRMSPYTVRAFVSDLRLFADYLGPHRALHTVRSLELEQFLHYLRHDRGVPCNLKSLARRLTTLKVFFAWLAEKGVLTTDPAAPLVHRRPGSPLPQVLSDGAVGELIEAAQHLRRDPKKQDARPLLLLTLVLDTGIKKGECMSIALSDLNLTDSTAPSLYVRYDSARNKFKERRLRLSKSLIDIYAEYTLQYRPSRRLFECTARNLEYVLADCSKRAGLPAGSVNFESLRWTCAVRELRAGLDSEALRRKLGLSRITWAGTLEKLQRLLEPAL